MASCAFGAETTGSWSKLFSFWSYKKLVLSWYLYFSKYIRYFLQRSIKVDWNCSVELLTKARRNTQPASESSAKLESRHLTSLYD